MNITELVRNPAPEVRRVGIRFENRLPVVQSAKRIYLELGVACDLEEAGISIPVPRIAAPWYLGLLERATGTPGYSDWDT